jgi:hypothetical protein
MCTVTGSVRVLTTLTKCLNYITRIFGCLPEGTICAVTGSVRVLKYFDKMLQLHNATLWPPKKSHYVIEAFVNNFFCTLTTFGDQ